MPYDLEREDDVLSAPAGGRGADGRFRPGNTAALTHGLRSRQVQGGALLPPGAALPADRERAILSDLGGDVSTVTAGLVRRRTPS